MRLAKFAHSEAQARASVAFFRPDLEHDHDRLGRAARAFAALNLAELAQATLRRLGEVSLERIGGDRGEALRCAADAFQRAIEADPVRDESLVAELMLLQANTLWELWFLDKNDVNLLGHAQHAFEGALERSPLQSHPARKLEAARGLNLVLGARLEHMPHRSEKYKVRYLRVHACRSAIDASNQLFLTGHRSPRRAQVKELLWAYQTAVDDFCAMGYHGAALATAEQGRARAYRTEIDQPSSGSSEAALPTSAEELTSFVEERRRGLVVLAWYNTAATCHAFVLHGGSGEVRSVATKLPVARLEAFAQLAHDSIWHRPSAPDEPLSPGWDSVMDALIPMEWRPLVTDAEDIVLVPHGVVSDLPLHALPVTWLGGRSLLETARVTYLPGVAVGNRLRGRSRGGEIALVMAHSGSPGAKTDFEDEACMVAAMLGTEHLYVGADAQADCLSDYSSRAALIHIAAHGSFDDRDPEASGVVLSSAGGGSQRLTARDVTRLPQLPGSVVVLSRCETSRSSNDLTAESYGLVRAFLLAGAATVVASQWRVDSPSTRLLMTRFHSILQGSDDVAGSLRTAALSLKEEPETRHPFFLGTVRRSRCVNGSREHRPP